MSSERPDIEAARKRASGAPGAAPEIKDLPEHLWPGETVEEIAAGLYQYRRGLLALTDRRVVFLARGVTGGRTEDFPFDRVRSVQFESSLMLASVVMYVNGARCRIDSMKKSDARRMASCIRSRLPGSGQPAEQPANGRSEHQVVTLLKDLGELRDVGVLTPDEFRTKKIELLARL